MRPAILFICVGLVAACASETSPSPSGDTPSKGRPGTPNTGPSDPGDPLEPAADCTGAPGELYELTAKRLAITSDLKFCALKGRVLLIVNGASECGYTPQYGPLQELYAAHESEGLTVLAFPSDSFNQEKDTDEAVTEACTNKYGITFPLLTIGPVVDNKAKQITAQPVFQWIYAQPGMSTPIAWNFEKFLIGRDGKIVKRWLSATSPSIGSEIDTAIKAELAK